MTRLAKRELDAWRAFLGAHARITRRINRDLAEAGLPDLSWYDALYALHEADGRRLRVSEVADAVVLSPTGTSRFVDRLEREGLVRREAVAGDRRALHVVLTDAGRDLLRRMWPVYSAGIAAYFASGLNPEAGRALHAIADGLRSPP